MSKAYLTKSRFQLALECPTKLFYQANSQYVNKKQEDPFLESLAEGGFQVGALAQAYQPGGVLVESLNLDQALAQTQELMKAENVIIFEAAFSWQNLLVRVDILEKKGGTLLIKEVKAKSFMPGKDEFLTKGEKIKSGCRSYISDIAFQKYVVSKAEPDFTVKPFLIMTDKSSLCPTDGLNQKFLIKRGKDGRKFVEISPDLGPKDLDPSILVELDVDDYCQIYLSEYFTVDKNILKFEQYVKYLSDFHFRGEKIKTPLGKKCGDCEFKATKEDLQKGFMCGFRECWSETLGWEEDDFQDSTVLDLWDYRKKDEMIAEGRIKLKDMIREDIEPTGDGKPGLSRKQRQWLQVEKVKNQDESIWLDKESLSDEMLSWTLPLHFIDFETSMAAIPFIKGMHPYEGIAFQFSHHLVHADGRVEHRGQFLSVEPGVFPNFDFIRAFKGELEEDKGTVFCYTHHENSYLNYIKQQITKADPHLEDEYELIEFIESITYWKNEKGKRISGHRKMVDMFDLVKRYYYDPATNGSNSIKYVLPAILNSSDFLQEKYSLPLYGSRGKDAIKSLNFADKIWVEYDLSGTVKDPYDLLPAMFSDLSSDEAKKLELLTGDDNLQSGGAALAAYGKLQFEEMSDYEREEISRALLKYCELDTLAMVMIYEAWKDFCS